MKFLVIIGCILVVASAIPLDPPDLEGQCCEGQVNRANEQSEATIGEKGSASAHGNVSAGGRERRTLNVADQVSNSDSGDFGTSYSSGTAIAGRERRDVVVEAPVSAVQKSIAATGNGPAVATGNAVAAGR